MDASRLRERARLGLDQLRGEHSAATLELDPLQVARELLNRVDRPDALDLDGDPVTGIVASHEVDGPDIGRQPAPHELHVLTKRAWGCLAALTHRALFDKQRHDEHGPEGASDAQHDPHDLGHGRSSLGSAASSSPSPTARRNRVTSPGPLQASHRSPPVHPDPPERPVS
jgi:hypothetical protein